MASRLTVASTLVLSLFCSSLLAAEDWPQFRGPTGQGISTSKNVPIDWSATKNVAWKVDVPGRGWSSPVLSNGRLYLTSAIVGSGAPATLRAICLDAADGKILWNTQVFQPDPSAVRAEACQEFAGQRYRRSSPLIGCLCILAIWGPRRWIWTAKSSGGRIL